MKKAIGVVVLFLVVFVLGLAWSFPLEAVALRGVADLEGRTGLRFRWTNARWSWWESRLEGVVVRDARGNDLVEFQSVQVSPGWGHIDVDARASWGGFVAVVRGDHVEGTLTGYPLSRAAPGLPLADARLGARFRYMGRRSQFQGDLTLTGNLKTALYSGPLTLQGALRAEGRSGTLERLDVSGEGLSGRAEAISLSLPADGLENLRVSGVVRLVYKGLNTTFNVGGQGRNITATLAAPGGAPPPVPPPSPAEVPPALR